MYRREGWTSYTCECGLTLSTKYKTPSNGCHAAHLRSVYHRNYRRIQAYLASDCMTLEQMAQRLGVTRERVRQILRSSGQYHPQERRTACKLNRRSAKLRAQLNSLADTSLGRFVTACGGRSVECTLIETKEGFHRHQVIAGNKLVLVKKVQHFTNSNFVRIVSTSQPVDLIAFELPDGRWLFRAPWVGNHSPARKYPKSSSTMFALHDVRPGDKGHTYHCNHDQRAAIDAWHLLTTD